MARNLMGKKRGMIQLFDDNGNSVACTVIHAESNIVTQLKTREKDGYQAVQLAFDEIRVKDERTLAKRCSKPLLGHYKKAQVPACRHLHEFRYEDDAKYEIGQKLGVSIFEGESHVDITGISKGKGYQGVIKKYGFSGGPAAHGSGFHRHAGSTGMRSSPGRCLPGGPRPSHMGDEQVTVQSLRIIAIDEKENLIIVEGAVPGAKNGTVILSSAKKISKPKKAKK